MDTELPRQVGEPSAGRPLERLGLPDLVLVRTQKTGVLGGGHELRAALGGPDHERPGLLPVGLRIGGGVHLDDGGESHRALLESDHQGSAEDRVELLLGLLDHDG